MRTGSFFGFCSLLEEGTYDFVIAYSVHVAEDVMVGRNEALGDGFRLWACMCLA